MKPHFAADSRHAKGVAITADACHHSRHQSPGLGVRGFAEAERIHRGNRAGPHGEDIAQNAADPGGGTLIGFDVAGVVVAFHLEDHRLTVADINHTGVFAGATDHLWPGGRQGAEPFFRGFIGAMLVPHRGKDAKLGERRHPADDPEQAGVFIGFHPVGGDKFRGDCGFGHRSFPCALLASLLGQAPPQ